MIVLGLTGGIGMGKTTVAAQFQSLGVPVCNADDIVHRLLAPGGEAAAAVGEAFPEAVRGGAIDRSALGGIVFGDGEKRRRLESILHPLVIAGENAFIEEQKKRGAKAAALEIPLLYETGAESRCDKVIVVTAPPETQKQRALARPNMTEEKLSRILALQMPDAEKRRRADFVVDTGGGMEDSMRQVKNVLRTLGVTTEERGRHA